MQRPLALFRLISIVSVCLISIAGGQEKANSNKEINLQYGHSSNWETDLRLNPGFGVSKDWEVEIADGRSQVVAADGVLYVLSGESRKEDETTLITHRTNAIDVHTGQVIWSKTEKSTMFEDQETFGGATPAPQATPAIVGDKLVSLGFTGCLVCRKRDDGSIVWSKDLVVDYSAEPVQFGFSSSPIVDPENQKQILVNASGESAGLLCLRVDDGSVVWKSECKTCSYATPVSAKFGGKPQWIVVSENRVFGVSKADGKKLWEYQLPAQEMTNVPTPIAVDSKTLIVSGQGCKGTRCLDIVRDGEQWKVSERWYERKLQYFYTNWLKLNSQVAIGCTDSFLASFDVNDGSILGRWRGFSDGNVAKTRNGFLVMDGKGKLNFVSCKSTGSELKSFDVTHKFSILDARCWTPLTVVDDRILIRGDGILVCLRLTKGGDSNVLENQINSSKVLLLSGSSADDNKADPVESIFEAFQNQGQEAALKLYEDLRKNNGLDEAARITLAQAAQDQGLSDVAKLIIGHAVEDYPASKEIKTVAESIRGQ